jgi:hypothetical protein
MGKHRCNRPQNGVAKHRNQRATVVQVSEETQACGERCQLSVASERCQLCVSVQLACCGQTTLLFLKQLTQSWVLLQTGILANEA